VEFLKVVLTGPESSGKSSLCKQLAQHFGVDWVPEYARIYLEKNGPEYDWNIFQEILNGHLDWQAEALKRSSHPLIFLDTDLVNFIVWSNMVFKRSLSLGAKELAPDPRCHYLLLAPDLAWEPDPLRENPAEREAIFEAHLQILKKHRLPFRVIKGEGSQRTANAIKAVHELLGLRT
jgi:nicotinamide riboside kinase